MAIKHVFTSAKEDGADETLVRPSNWNADHTFDCTMRDGSTVAYASPSGTRVKDTVYQNTSGKTRFVVVTVLLEVSEPGNSALIFGTSEVYPYCGASNPPTIMVGSAYLSMYNFISHPSNAPTGLKNRKEVMFLVPANYYYKLVGSNSGDGGVPEIYKWIEWDF